MFKTSSSNNTLLCVWYFSFDNNIIQVYVAYFAVSKMKIKPEVKA